MAYAEVVKREPTINTNDCTICQLSFNDARVLKCGHEFCKDCIGKWIVNSPLNKSEEKGIDCPVCRRVTGPPIKGTHPSKWANQLPHNDDKGTHPGEGKKTGQSKNDTVKCGPCQSTSISADATVYCSDCQEHLCSECQTNHKKLKITKGHTLVEVDEGTETSQAIVELNHLLHCKQHRDKEFEFYCHDHDELVCSTCAFIEHRHCDDIKEIQNDSELTSEALPAFITRENTKTLHNHVSDVIRTQESYEQLLHHDLKELPVKLKQFREMVNRRLDKFESRILREGKEMHAVLDEAVKQERKTCEGIANKLKAHLRIAGKLTQLAKSSRRHFVLTRSLKNERELIRSDVNQEGKGWLPNEFLQIKFQANEEFVNALDHDKDVAGLVSVHREINGVPELPDESTTFDDFSLTYVKRLRKSMTTKKKQSQAPICEFLDETHIAIAGKAKLIHIIGTEDEEDNSQIKLKSQPWGMTFMRSQTMLAVSHPAEKKISIYNTHGEYSLAHEVKMRKQCYGLVQLNGGDILVSLCEDLDDWSLCTINIQGKVKGELTSDSTGRKFKSLWYFTVDGGSVYQSCSHTDQVYKFDLQDGTHHFQYRSDQLKGVAGITVDIYKNVYVCGLVSKNVNVISEKGEAVKIFQPPECSIPLHIACSIEGNCIAIIDQERPFGANLYEYTINS